MIPELIELFLSGFIFMCIFSKLNCKEFDISILCLCSLFISHMIKISFSWIHSFIFASYDVNDNLKVIAYVVTGVILPFIATYIYKSEIFRKILLKTNSQTVNSDIFNDIFDYDTKTIVQVFLKDSDYYYIGTLILKEENREDAYIALIDYAFMNKNDNNVDHRSDLNNLALINLNDVERLEVHYSSNSQIPKRLRCK